jgi:hypothetical protein
LDPTRHLASITLSYNPALGYNLAQLAVFGVTATPIAAGCTQVETAVTSGPFGPNGTVSPGYTHVTFGPSLTVTATASAGYNFVDWIVDDTTGTYAAVAGVASAGSSKTTLTTGSNICLLTASFSPQICTLTIATGSGNGTATANVAPPYYYGQYVPVTVTPSPGWQLGSETLTNCTYASTSLLFSGNANAVFNFTQVNYTVSGATNKALVPGGGNISWSPTGTQHYGTVVTYVATPNLGYYLVDWALSPTASSGSWDSVNDVASPTVTVAVLGNVTMTASFAANSYAVTLAQPTGGAIGASSASASYNQVVTLSQTPANAGYAFQGYLVTSGASTISNGNKLTVTGDVTVTGSYSQNTYTGTEADLPGNGGTIALVGGPYTSFTFSQIVGITASPADGFYFNHWNVIGVNGLTILLSNSTTATNSLQVFDGFTLDADFTAIASSLTGATNPNGIGSVTFDGSATETGTIGQIINLVAADVPNYTFSYWTVIATDSDSVDYLISDFSSSVDNPNSPTANLTIPDFGPVDASGFPLTDMNLTVIANYVYSAPTTFTIQVNPTTGGNVTINPAGPFNSGDTPTILATPFDGYSFTGWTFDTNVTYDPNDVTAASTTVAVIGNAVLSANFALINYSSTLTQVGGTITIPDGPYHYGDYVVITANPGTGMGFGGWNNTGLSTLSDSTAQTTTLQVFGDFDLTAVFTALSYNVTGVVVPASGGTISPVSATGSYLQTISLSQTTNAGYTFTGYTFDDGNQGAVFNGDSTAVILGTASVTVSANYSLTPFRITVNQTTGGNVNVTGGPTYFYGDTPTITAVADLHYKFTGWNF